MSYISSEAVKALRTQIKKTFPRYKWSITRNNYSGVRVELLCADFNLKEMIDLTNLKRQERDRITSLNTDYLSLNDNYLETYPEKISNIFRAVNAIINSVEAQKDYSENDPSSDYCNCNYYVYLSIGTWDTPYQQIA